MDFHHPVCRQFSSAELVPRQSGVEALMTCEFVSDADPSRQAQSV